MLEQFNLKQKIIGGIVIGIIVIGIAIYGFISMSQTQEMLDISQMVNLENTQNQVESENNIIENQNVIIVHITGEVKKTGILILPEGARIADAVEAAVQQVLTDGYRTGDIYSDGCKKVGTKEMGDLIAERIKK